MAEEKDRYSKYRKMECEREVKAMQVDSRSILYMLAQRFKLTRSTMKERLKLQKIVYLLQACGMQLGYGYIWYKYGPYSYDLVIDAYTVLNSERDKYEEGTKEWKFSESTEERFKEFEKILGDILKDAGQLELLASVHYLYNKDQGFNLSDDNFMEEFKKRKPTLFDGLKISDESIKETLQKAKQLRANLTN